MNELEFRENILEEVRLSSESNCTDPKSEFINLITNILMDAEEFEDFTECYFESIGKSNKKIQIDGFFFDDVDNSCMILINNFIGKNELETITNTQISKLFERIRNFVEHSISGYIGDNCEESSPGYAFALNISEKFNDIPKFRFYIITDQKISKQVKNLKMDNIKGTNVELNVWDIERIYNLVQSKKGKESIEIDFKNSEHQGIPCVKASECTSDDYEAYLAIISGQKLSQIYIKYGARLLEGNVRSFLSTRGKVNKAIRNTLLNKPEMFFAYNNGIAATALDVELEKNDNGLFITKIKDLQIINGGQTTASIANSVLHDKIEAENIFIPMKLSIVSHNKAEEIIPTISRCANSQNKVSEADFFSNHPFHVRMEEYSRKIYAPAVGGNQYQTIWFYERARGQYTQEQMKLSKAQRKKYSLKYPKNQLIKKTDLAKYLNTYNCVPHVVSKGAQASMRYFAEEIDKTWEKSDTNYNEVYYKKAIALTIMFRETEKIISNLDWYKAIRSYRANIVTYTLAAIFNEIKINYNDKTINFKKIWSDQTMYKEMVTQIEKTSKIVYNCLTTDDRTTLMVTEWCKKQTCWNWVKELNLQLSNSFINTLIDINEEKEEAVAAKRSRKSVNEINTEIEVVKQGGDYWKRILIWGDERKLLSPIEKDLLAIASKMESTGKVPSSRQAKRIIEIRQKLFDEGLHQE